MEPLANLTQVITNSPQVNTLVAGEMAAVETANRRNQIEESQKLQELVQKTVLAMEEGRPLDETDPDSRRRQETRREQRQRRREAARAERVRRAALLAAEKPESPARPEDPFDPAPVIDICV